MPLKPLTFAALLLAAAAFPAAAPGAVAYKSAIAIDAATGTVLFQENADAVSPPASMTKLMTYATLCDYLQAGKLTLQTRVTVSREAARVGAQRDSTVVWLKQGETFTVDELIYAMMIQSANDAAWALAEQAAGSVPAFVGRMNAKARALGMVNSTFRTPNGFPVASHRVADGDLTSPRDYALLCRYLVLHTEVLRYTSVKTRPFGAGIRLQPTVMTNHNHLLGRVAGVDGLKTGFTNGAGFCLSCTALRNGHRVIAVMMNSPEAKVRDLNMRQLLDDAFVRIPVSEPPFAPAPGAPGPTPPAAPGAAGRPAPDGPVITLPGR